MFILPYLDHKRELPHLTIHEYCILTQGGNQLWSEDETVLRLEEDMLGPNGFIMESQKRYKDVVWCKLKDSSVNMNDYYEWKEITDHHSEDTFCWRRFYLFGPIGSSDYSLEWLPFPETETLGTYTCKELFTTFTSLSSSSSSPSLSSSPSSSYTS